MLMYIINLPLHNKPNLTLTKIKSMKQKPKCYSNMRNYIQNIKNNALNHKLWKEESNNYNNKLLKMIIRATKAEHNNLK